MQAKTVRIACRAAATVRLRDIELSQGNLCELSVDNHERLRASITHHGFTFPIAIWRDGDRYRLLDGHARVLTLRKMAEEGWTVPDLPAVLVDAADEGEAMRKLLAARSQYHKTTAQGLYEFLGQYQITLDDVINVADVGIDFDKFKAEYYDPSGAGPSGRDVGGDSVPSQPGAELNSTWQVQPGDVWSVGRHRLICGDCTNPTIGSAAMGTPIDQLLTDPPYEYGKRTGNRGGNKSITKPIANDDAQADAIDDYAVFYAGFLQHVRWAEHNTAYVFSGGRELHSLRIAFDSVGLHFSSYLIWLKNNHTLGRTDYSSQCEFIAYGWNNKHRFYGGFSSNVLEYALPVKNDLHPTMKPIDLLQRLLHDGSAPGAVVYDPFLGSGSTLMACEATDRICVGVEIDPAYCAVILQRATNAGLQCKRLGAVAPALVP